MTLNEIRDHYYKYRTEFYLLNHPGVSRDKAYKYARVAWSRKLKKRKIVTEAKKQEDK